MTRALCSFDLTTMESATRECGGKGCDFVERESATKLRRGQRLAVEWSSGVTVPDQWRLEILMHVASSMKKWMLCLKLILTIVSPIFSGRMAEC
ncbi:hypothetical protein MRB53_033254 [Persea americana]|uniref:Uncharacterized protein n=1 Tax=Persea americana TaxID=3435 RepID=A0ACC2KU59_PERAE|nr:hypothetical protein MRB53_033254 [Persea americana]